MANAINLSPDKILKVNNEISSLNKSLVGNYLPEYRSLMEAINTNVKNTNLQSVIKSICTHASTIETDLGKELTKLETFLDEQMKQYALTEEEAIQKIQTALARMNAFSSKYGPTPSGGGVAAGNGGLGTGDFGTGNGALNSSLSAALKDHPQGEALTQIMQEYNKQMMSAQQQFLQQMLEILGSSGTASV